MVSHTIEGFGSLRMPKAWAARGVDDRGDGVVQEFRRTQRWHWGSGDPLEAHAFVMLARPNASATSTRWLEAAMQQAFADVQVNCRRFDEFGNIQTGTRTTWISQGNYQIATNHDPERVIFLRSIDARRRAALVMRVYERRIVHETLRRIEHRFFDSLGTAQDEHDSDNDDERAANNAPVAFTPPDESKVAFNMNDQTVLVMDQLRPWRIYTLMRPLRAVNGRECPAGMVFRFENARVNLKAGTARINGLGPDDEALSFDSKGSEHRESFCFTGQEWRPGTGPRPQALPAATGPFDPSSVPPGHERALAIMRGELSPRDWGSLRADADVLRSAVLKLQASHPQAARHMAERSQRLYYSWMSQATSGGEGTAMQYEVRNELQELKQLLGE